METPIAHLIGPQARDLLSIVPETNPNHVSQRGEKRNYFGKLLDSDIELSARVNSLTSYLQAEKVPMPLIHITSSSIDTPNGPTSTGFLENITSNGFRARDTNVAGFMRRDVGLRFASPQYLYEHPDKYLQDLSLVLQRYKHHGIRTNKSSLGELQNGGRGIPVLIAIDARGVKLQKASDYDDHFILTEPTAASKIIGIIDLKDIAQDSASFKKITEGLLLNAKEYYGREATGNA